MKRTGLGELGRSGGDAFVTIRTGARAGGLLLSSAVRRSRFS